MSARADTIAEQLAMFEAESNWQARESNRQVYRMAELRAMPPNWAVTAEAREVLGRIDEIAGRARSLMREYCAWLEREGIREAVDEILASRRAKR